MSNLGYMLQLDAYNNMSADDLREELKKLVQYAERIEAERDELQKDLDREQNGRDADEEDARDACDEIADALDDFMRQQGAAGGEWYKKDARVMLDKIADAFGKLPTIHGNDVETMASYTY